MSIALIIRDIPYLKLLQPIIGELIIRKVPYSLYHYDTYRGEKEYLRASRANIEKSSKLIIEKATKVKPFSDDKYLLELLLKHNITKLISVEINLWGKEYLNYFKNNNIKTYSIQYLTDSMWSVKQKHLNHIDRIYYSTPYIMSKCFEFNDIKFDQNRDRCFGSPIFEHIEQDTKNKNLLVLLPNLKSEHVQHTFGSEENFLNIMRKLYNPKQYNIILKTRKKQWLPNSIKQFGEVKDDGDVMYKPAVINYLKDCTTTVMFNSSGIYECVLGGNYVINVKLPLTRWSWDQKKLQNYFNSNLYNFKGVVESIDQKTILDKNYEFSLKQIDPIAKKEWVNSFIGNTSNSIKLITEDILI